MDTNKLTTSLWGEAPATICTRTKIFTSGRAPAKGASTRRSRTTPRNKPARPKESNSLTRAQVLNVIAGARFAATTGTPLNRLLTFDWQLADVVDPSYATSRFFKLAGDAVRKRGMIWACTWVLENGPVMGVHLHALIHMPAEDLNWFQRRCNRWAKTCGMSRRKGARHSRAVGIRNNDDSYALNLERALEYIMKDAEPLARDEFGISRKGAGGTVTGKRAGVSQNLGPKARSKRPDPRYSRKLEIAPQETRVANNCSLAFTAP